MLRKKTLLVALLIASLGICSHAQPSLPDEFFGLKFEKSYSLNEMEEHVGKNGVFVECKADTLMSGFGINYSGYEFSDVYYDGYSYPSMTLLFLEHGSFAGVVFTFNNLNISAESSLDTIYEELQVFLKKYGELSEFPVMGNPDVYRLMNINNGVALRLDKCVSESKIVSIQVSYISLTAVVIDGYKAVLPTIQDTFLGLEMGSCYTPYSIKSAVGCKGEYFDEHLDYYGKIIEFTKVLFAGKTWDFGRFSLTDNGELYRVAFYDSLEDGFGHEDDMNEAKETFDVYKAMLDDKYGLHDVRESENSKYVTYSGWNNVAIILSNERGKSAGGKYRRYIKIECYQTAILNKLSGQGAADL